MNLRERADDVDWYHSIDLGEGVVTKGVFDLRGQVDNYDLPNRLDGKRVLDIGTQNGFWAFEMERRGAAQVVALDLDDPEQLDWPPRRRGEVGAPLREEGLRLASGRAGFELAREALDSNVQRVTSSLYDARPEVLGTFDVVFCGSVLMHMRDQLLALERVANLCDDLFVSAEEFDLLAGAWPIPASRYMADRAKAVVFWLPSARTWRRMIWSAGFDDVRRVKTFKLRAVQGWTVRHVLHHARKKGPNERESTS